MTTFSNEQIGKLFYLAGLKLPTDIKPHHISNALIEIEKKITNSTFYESSFQPDEAPSILIIDDLEVSIYQLNLLLTRSGYNVCVARSSIEALDQFKKQCFEYILLDLYIPDAKDGLTVLETFANSEKTKINGTKIIVMSGTDNKSLINQCLEQGADEYVGKSPDWHKNVLKLLKQFETKKHERPKMVSHFLDEEKGVAIISLNNSYNSRIPLELKKEFISIINSGCHNIILDMSKFNKIDSNGIETLIFGYTVCSEHGGNFKIFNLCSSVYETLSYVHLQNIIKSYKNKEAALEQ